MAIYDSYNREMAAQKNKSLGLTNFTEVYSLTNVKKYDVDNFTQKQLLWKQFVAWHCNGSSVLLIVDDRNNPIFQELPDEDEYYSDKNDERIYLHLRATSGYVREAEKLKRNDSQISLHIMLKKAATKKFSLRIWAYSLGEYLYILAKNKLALKHRTYAINQSDDDFLE